MKDLFIPYKQALYLKELGFNETCITFYSSDNKLIFNDSWAVGVENNDLPNPNWKPSCTSPLWQQAFDWFREEHSIHSWITSKTTDKGDTVFIPHGRTNPDTIKKELVVDVIPYKTFSTHREAEHELLQRLIELIKS